MALPSQQLAGEMMTRGIADAVPIKLGALALRSALSSALLIALSGCADDLGECDPEAAHEIVYGRGGLVATKGQALAHDSCGNAAFCHSASAQGSARHGAPHGMSFDMLPAPSGWPVVNDERDAIWSEVLDGNMPPAGIGSELRGDGEWMFDVERAPTSETLPALATDEGKGIFRNWLACGAPVVTETRVPSWALPPIHGGDGGAATDFQALFAQVIRPSCAVAGCHNQAAAGGLAMLNACSARDHLLASGACGRPRVVPGSAGSLLLDKIEHSMPACGAQMPPTGLLSSDAREAIRAWVLAGADAEGCE